MNLERDRLNEEFDKRHADSRPVYRMGGTFDPLFVFSNGAHRNSYGNFREDPESQACIEMKIAWWQQHRKACEEEFTSLKRILKQKADRNHLDREGLAKLRELQREVMVTCPTEIANARWELSLFPMRTRKAVLRAILNRLPSMNFRFEEQRIAELRHKLVEFPDDEDLIEQIEEIEDFIAQQQKERPKHHAKLMKEHDRIKALSYEEFLEEAREKERQSMESDFAIEQQRIAEGAGEYRQELHALDI